MQKSGIKSFIFSFIFSLCAVFAVDKAILHTQKQVEPTKKITYKNIALFSQDKGTIVASATMTNIADLQKTQDIEIKEENIENTVQPEKEIQNEIVFAPETKIEQPVVVADSAFVYNPDAAPQTAEEELSFEEALKLSQNQTVEEPIEVAQNEVVPNNSAAVEDKDDKTIIAENDVVADDGNISLADTSWDENINLWIPLEKSAQKSMDIASAQDEAQVAMSGGDVMISSLVNATEGKPEETKEEETAAGIISGEIIVHHEDENASVEDNSSPWVIARGTKFPKNRNVITDKAYNNLPVESIEETAVVAEEISVPEAKVVADTLSADKDLTQKPDGSVDVAYKVMQNILIPVPDDILKNDNLTPNLESSDDDDEDEEDVVAENPLVEEKTEEPKKESKGFFKSLGSLFSSSKDKNADENLEEYEIFANEKEPKKQPSDKKPTTGIKYFSNDEEIPEILPTEIRLSFQPERAEISGSTLKWLKAFADNANKHKDIYIEIRIDGSNSFALQQKRLNLLQGVFLENGVPQQKIETIFTSREPNSFVIRSMKINPVPERKEQKKEQPTYYQSW